MKYIPGEKLLFLLKLQTFTMLVIFLETKANVEFKFEKNAGDRFRAFRKGELTNRKTWHCKKKMVE